MVAVRKEVEQVPVVKTVMEEKRKYILELDEDDANALYAASLHVGGCPEKSGRGFFDRIRDAFHKFPELDERKMKTTCESGLYFVLE